MSARFSRELREQRIEPTVSLMVLTLALSLSFAIPMGVIAAWKHGTLIDRFVMFLAVFGFSTPVFVIGYLGDSIKEYIAKESPQIEPHYVVQEVQDDNIRLRNDIRIMSDELRRALGTGLGSRR